MSLETTLFDLPNDPEQISVLLPPARLRNIDYSALDFSNCLKSIIEYIKTYYPNDFNDFVNHTGVIMLADIMASLTAKIGLRGDLLANEAFLPTCRSEEAVINHLALINQHFKLQTPAIVDIEVSISKPLSIDFEIDPGIILQTKGPDNNQVYYEVYQSPGDYTSKIIIPAGKRGVIAYGIEGKFAATRSFVSTGGANQAIVFNDENVLESPIVVMVNSDNWIVTTDPLERYDSDDGVVNVKIRSDYVEFNFGDDINGKAPIAGQTITIRYRCGGGKRGRIATGVISDTRTIAPSNARVAIPVLFRNISPSVGGTDRETPEEAKRRAPRDFAVRAFASDRPASIVTADDYVQVANSFSHPVYGSVAKAVATLRSSKNVNLVELYVLVEGQDQLALPNAGLKKALATYISEYNVMTDTVQVLDGGIKAVDIDMVVVISKNTDATFVRNKVNAAIDGIFDINNIDMGQTLYLSSIIEAVMAIDGVKYINLFEPADNIISSGIVGPSTTMVGINEVLVEGSRNIKIYYE